MGKTEIGVAVGGLLGKWLGHTDFQGSSSLQALGLDRDDVQEILIRLENALGLTILPGVHDRFLDTATSVDSLVEFLFQQG